MSPTVATIALAISALVLALVWVMAADRAYRPAVGYSVVFIVALFWVAAIATATPPPEPPAWPELVSYSGVEEVKP